MKKILLVDDEYEMLKSLNKILSYKKDFDITMMQNSEQAFELVEQEKFDLIITDLKMDKVSGIDLMKSALAKFPDTPVIIISGYGTIESSVEAMSEGAFGFIEKPFSSKKLFALIDRVFTQSFREEGISEQSKNGYNKYIGMVYKSEKMAEIIKLIKKIAIGNMSVLITGESGTGKELIARAVHSLSQRRMNTFVPINCGALPEPLFESELFGYERGAFTGAVKTKTGLLEYANNGVFFFDEIGDMPETLQIKLLRMLEDKKIRRVGGQKEIDIDVRIIAATNKNVEKLVEQNKLRTDLFYRLNTIRINIPPLRERVEDIIPLTNYFLYGLNANNEKVVHRISSDAAEALKAHQWPGNVRELKNIISRAYYLCSSKVIQIGDLSLPAVGKPDGIDESLLKMPYKAAKKEVLEKFEIEYLTYRLKKNKGNISKTASECGIDRRTIHRFLNEHKIIYHDS